MAYERRVTDFKGEKTLEEWIDVYERRAGDDVHYQLDEREKVWYSPNRGFFTYIPDHAGQRLLIPKMCGDGRYLRHVAYMFLKVLEPLGFKCIYLCSRHRPEVYLRVLGGRFDHVEETININTGKAEPLYYYTVTADEFKEKEAKVVADNTEPQKN